MNSNHPRLMGIDYGSKRVGIASTNETGEFALPRAVWPNDKELVDKILAYKEEEGVESIVIGESRGLDQSSNPVLKGIKELKAKLEERGARVVLHPELFTTLEARRLQGNHDLIDASAASLILKSYIDTQNSEV